MNQTPLFLASFLSVHLLFVDKDLSWVEGIPAMLGALGLAGLVTVLFGGES